MNVVRFATNLTKLRQQILKLAYEYRIEKNLNQTEFAKLIGVSRTRWSRIESKHDPLSNHAFDGILKQLKLQLICSPSLVKKRKTKDANAKKRT